MIQYIQFIIFSVILGIFIYYQKNNIIDKFNNAFEGFTNNLEGFKSVSNFINLFSLEKPRILSNEINVTTEGVPTIALDLLFSTKLYFNDTCNGS